MSEKDFNTISFRDRRMCCFTATPCERHTFHYVGRSLRPCCRVDAPCDYHRDKQAGKHAIPREDSESSPAIPRENAEIENEIENEIDDRYLKPVACVEAGMLLLIDPTALPVVLGLSEGQGAHFQAAVAQAATRASERPDRVATVKTAGFSTAIVMSIPSGKYDRVQVIEALRAADDPKPEAHFDVVRTALRTGVRRIILHDVPKAVADAEAARPRIQDVEGISTYEVVPTKTRNKTRKYTVD